MRDWIIFYVLMTVFSVLWLVGMVRAIMILPDHVREWRAILREDKKPDA